MCDQLHCWHLRISHFFYVYRSIDLNSCFDINRRADIKHKHAVALYTQRDVFTLLFDSAADLEDWLQALLFLTHGQDLAPGEELRPKYGELMCSFLQVALIGIQKRLENCVIDAVVCSWELFKLLRFSSCIFFKMSVFTCIYFLFHSWSVWFNCFGVVF